MNAPFHDVPSCSLVLQVQRQHLATDLPVSRATDDAGGVQHAQPGPVPRPRLRKRPVAMRFWPQTDLCSILEMLN